MSLPPPVIAKNLQTALEMLRAGRFESARAVLRRLLESCPQLVDAHWLMAGLHFESGDMGSAQNALQKTLHLDPNLASAHVLLGEVQTQTGKPDSAEHSFRQALVLQPNHLPAATKLAYLLLGQNRPHEALKLVESYLGHGYATPSLLMLQGQALLALKRAQEAVDAFTSMLRHVPNSVEGETGLAVALTESGRSPEAETLLRKGIMQGRDIPESHFVLARSLMAQQRNDEAITELRAAVHARPDYLAAQVNLGELIWMQTGDVQAASEELDAALHSNPGWWALRNAKATILEVAQTPEDAIAELEAGLAFSGESFDLDLAIAQIALKCDAPRALEYAGRALHMSPGNAAALAAYCGALLGMGRAREASEIALQLHGRNKNDNYALALLATAWRLLGDPRYMALYDYQFVIPQNIETPGGWSSLEAYLTDLAAGLHRLHTHQMHPIGQSLRRGSQADLDFDHAPDAAVKAFAQAINGPIHRYMQSIGTGNDELRRRNSGRYKLSGAWSVRLRPQGHHVNHIHPEGWLSSACYIELPPLGSAETHEAWIQFGEPGLITEPKLPAEHYVKPQPGLLVLFPSYMWHGTVPFNSAPDSTRLTVAFDVVPA